MLEVLVSAGMGGQQVYPESGPGTKVLKYGNEELGYFGEVPSSELFSLSELRRQTDFWVGTDAGNQNITWIKMFLEGKVIYFPTTAGVASTVSWGQLYAKGLVYGVDGPGMVPGTPAVNQLVYVNKDEYSFKVRCFKAYNTNPADQGGFIDIAKTETLKQGEWGKVISALLSPRQIGYTGDNWNVYPVGSWLLYGTGMALSQNTRLADSSQCIGINNTQAGLLGKSSAAYLWMPVLELTPETEVLYFPIKESAGVTNGTTLPATAGEPAYEDSLIAYRLFGGGVQMGRAINTGDVSHADPYYRVDVSAIKMANAAAVPLVVSSVTYE